MIRLLKRLIIIGLLVGGGYYLWSQRHHVANIHNNNLRIQGTWYVFEMDRKGFDSYHFADRFITWNGSEWGSYKLRSNEEIEVMIGTELNTYHLGFPDEDNMIWSTEVKGELVTVKHWRR